MHTTAVKQQNKKYFQKIALQTGKLPFFVMVIKKEFFLSLSFDN